MTTNVLKYTHYDDIYQGVYKTCPGGDHPTLEDIYGNLRKISMTVRQRRVQFAGRCAQASEELISSFVLWRYHHSHKRSRNLTFPDTTSRDMVISKEDLFLAMSDREVWKGVVN